MYKKKIESGYTQYFHCDCHDINHTVRLSYWEDKVYAKESTTGTDVIYPEVHIELSSTWWEEWYKRVWTSIKYIFNRGDWYYAGVSLSNKADVIRLRNMLNESLKQWASSKKVKNNE